MSNQPVMMNPGAQVVAFLRRVFASDFRSEKPTAWEMHRMGAAGAASRLVHSYTAWRSSLLYASGALLLFTAIWNLATFESSENQIRELIAQTQGGQITRAQRDMAADNAGIIDAVVLISRISALPAVGLIIASGVLWPRARFSMILARLGWALLFGVPFVMALLPVSSMMEYGALRREQELILKAIIGGMFAVQVILSLLPKALSLFPGLVRSSMALKTLLPQHRTPGWITVLLAPLFGLFLWLLMAVVNQFPETGTLLLGVMFILAGQLVYLLAARHIVRPYSTLPAKVIWPRRLSAILGLTGLLIIFIRLLAYEWAPTGNVIAAFIGIFGNVLLLSVVCSDFLLPLLRTGHKMTRDFVESPMYHELGRKCEDVSLAVTRTAQPQPPLETVQARAVADEVQTVQAKPVEDE